MKKICVNCGKEFDCYDKPGHRLSCRGKSKRAFGLINCSHKCSLEWGRK